MATGAKLPAWLKCIEFSPEVDERSHAFNIGANVKFAVLMSDVEYSYENARAAVCGMFNFPVNNTFSGTTSRIAFCTSSAGVDYYASTSGGQTWMFIDGVLTIETDSTSKWEFAAGKHYALFYL